MLQYLVRQPYSSLFFIFILFSFPDYSWGKVCTYKNIEVAFEDRKTNQKHTNIMYLIDNIVQSTHYKPIKLNDTHAENILHKYLEVLDPKKRYFLQQDIDLFKKNIHQLDDKINSYDAQIAFDIFKVYLQRTKEYFDFTLRQLKQPFDFNKIETIQKDASSRKNWPNTIEESHKYWQTMVKHDLLSLILEDSKNPEVSSDNINIMVNKLTKRYHNLNNSIKSMSNDDVFQYFTNTYLAEFDPHTRYFSPPDMESFNINSHLSLEGIGATLRNTDGYTKIVSLVAGGPAKLSKEIKDGDLIIGVGEGDGDIVDIVGWNLEDVVGCIRGKKGTKVKLKITTDEGSISSAKIVTLIRNQIDLESNAAKQRIITTQSEQKKYEIGVITLDSFYHDPRSIKNDKYRNVEKDVTKILNDFKQKGIDGVIIDLRGNSGGSLRESIKLTGLFIKKGPVVQILSPSKKTKILKDQDGKAIWSGPLAVLVDRNSASASEIFAAAIQDYNRGVIIGETTHGKGSVQHIMSLHENKALGHLKVTTSQFFRVNGASTQIEGVKPDIHLSLSPSVETTYGEKKYPSALPWKKTANLNVNSREQKEYPSKNLQQIEIAKKKHSLRKKSDPIINHMIELEKIKYQSSKNELISLNADIRLQDQKEKDISILRVVNQQRALENKPFFNTIEDYNDHVEAKNKNEEWSELDKVYIQESANILADIYLNAPKTLIQASK